MYLHHRHFVILAHRWEREMQGSLLLLKQFYTVDLLDSRQRLSHSQHMYADVGPRRLKSRGYNEVRLDQYSSFEN
jgi:hypothetical protein